MEALGAGHFLTHTLSLSCRPLSPDERRPAHDDRTGWGWEREFGSVRHDSRSSTIDLTACIRYSTIWLECICSDTMPPQCLDAKYEKRGAGGVVSHLMIFIVDSYYSIEQRLSCELLTPSSGPISSNPRARFYSSCRRGLIAGLSVVLFLLSRQKDGAKERKRGSDDGQSAPLLVVNAPREEGKAKNKGGDLLFITSSFL